MSNPQMQSLEQGVWGWIQAGGIKHRAPIGVRICKAFLAGIFLSLGGTLVDILTADPWFTTNAPGLLKIIQGLAFPVGLIMVVIFQADLVTTQMAIGIASTMKRRVPLWSMLVDIPLVFLANLAGALAYAGLIVHYGGVYTPAMATGAAAAADAKVVMLNFRQIFLSSIGCNFCVCAAVFMAFLANDIVSKIFACYGPIFCFVSRGPFKQQIDIKYSPMSSFTFYLNR
jgi:formate/nitrite transporter FocA (FNT family)